MEADRSRLVVSAVRTVDDNLEPLVNDGVQHPVPPLDNGNDVIPVDIQIFEFGRALQTVRVDVNKRHAVGSGVSARDDKRGAGDGPADLKLVPQPARERRFSGSQFTRQTNDVTGSEKSSHSRTKFGHVFGGRYRDHGMSIRVTRFPIPVTKS